ncbi:MAG: GNAT family N-acetyltransferase [Thermodesulfovibrionales bacterium]|jgi:RimJ/RimL family protein N-acetyltransferase
MKLKTLSLPDLEQVRQWRNESLSALRTPFLLTQEQQETFYRDVICNRQANARYWGVWIISDVTTIGGMQLQQNILIGMCGVENIQHENRLAEISLLLKPDHTIDANFPDVLKLLLHEGFMNMNLENIFTEAYDCNPNIHLWLAVAAEYNCKVSMLTNRKYHNGGYWNSRYINFNKGDYLEHENLISQPTQTLN